MPVPLRVLIVEDEALIRWSIAETLAQRGHEVLEATTAKAAVEALAGAANAIDVVLLDLRLPDSSDLGLLTTVRRLRPGCAVVVITAHSTPEVVRAALALGAHSVVSKPFDMRAIESYVLDAYGAGPK